MTSMTTATGSVTGGVDTHGQTHHGAVLDHIGRQLGDQEFPATPPGYRALLEWMSGYEALDQVGVEGTGTYGAGLTVILSKRRCGWSRLIGPTAKPGGPRASPTRLMPTHPARAALSGTATGMPKPRDGQVEAIRALRVARSSAVKASSQAINQLKALLVTGPAALREKLRHLSTAAMIAACARMRPADDISDPEQATKTALRRLARRYQQLSEEITDADADLHQLVHQVAPTLLALPGVGPEVAGQLLTTAGDHPARVTSEAASAHLCGVAPIPASSGRTHRHRLNRGGDRAANNALYIVVLGRMRYDTRTRAYADRRTQQGLSKPEIIRCLKRYVAREIYAVLQPATIDEPLKKAA